MKRIESDMVWALLLPMEVVEKWNGDYDHERNLVPIREPTGRRPLADSERLGAHPWPIGQVTVGGMEALVLSGLKDEWYVQQEQPDVTILVAKCHDTPERLIAESVESAILDRSNRLVCFHSPTCKAVLCEPSAPGWALEGTPHLHIALPAQRCCIRYVDCQVYVDELGISAPSAIVYAISPDPRFNDKV